MERSYKRKADLILCSDIHFREDTPTCWVGDFQEEQWTAVEFISNLQKEHECPVIHGGDLFHHWKPSPWLLSMTIEHLPNKFHTIYGQHDLPQHNFALRNKSGIYALEKANVLNATFINGAHYGFEPPTDHGCGIEYSEELGLGFGHGRNKTILVWHHLTYQMKPFPGAEGGMARGILRRYNQYDLIVTGDNHQAFVEEFEGRLLVNPGSLTRQKADQINFKPRVYLWYADTNTVTPVYIPIKDGVISREHIEEKEERNERISAFIEHLQDDYDITVSFEENIERFFNANPNIRDNIKDIIYKALENGN